MGKNKRNRNKQHPKQQNASGSRATTDDQFRQNTDNSDHKDKPAEPLNQPSIRRRIVARLDELTIQRLGLIVAAGLLIATWYQAFLTRQALEETRKQFTSSERPWVGIVGSPEVSMLDNTGIIARVHQPYMNVGKTPALNVVALLRLRIGDPIPLQSSGTIHVTGPVLKECAKGTPRLPMVEGPVALPNATHATMISPENDVISRWPDIVRNAVGLYLTGCIDYDDVFGHWHRTHVCLYWSRQTNGIIISCSEGNGAS